MPENYGCNLVNASLIIFAYSHLLILAEEPEWQESRLLYVEHVPGRIQI
jgi:hypothetical protein